MMDIFARILNFLIMIGMPFGLALFLVRKYRVAWRLFGVGVATFILSQVFHIPFNEWVLEPIVERLGLDLAQGGFYLAVVALMYGASAGFFEEITRYLGYRFWIKENRDWKSALMYGAGHGGIESILLGILVLATFIQIMTLRGVDLNTVFDADQVGLAQTQIETYWGVPWYQAILGAVERLAAMPIHLSASVLVLQAFRRKQRQWLFLAIGWHTAVDAVAVYALHTWGMILTEVLVGLFSLASVGIIIALKSEDVPSDDGSPGSSPPDFDFRSGPAPESPSDESLEESRYISFEGSLNIASESL